MPLWTPPALLAAFQDAAAPAGGEGAAAPPSGGGGLQMLITIGAIFAIFYFLMLRPQKKQEEARKLMLGALKKHDRVLTTGGLFGTVVDLREDEVSLRVAESPDVRVRISRGSIVEVLEEKVEDKK